MTKFKVGDKFVPRKPKGESAHLWLAHMDEYDGVILTVSHITKDGWLAPKQWGVCFFHVDWCEKVEERFPDVRKTIDWEQRRYEIARDFMTAQINSLYLKRKEWNYTDEARYAVNAADVLINQLQKSSEN